MTASVPLPVTAAPSPAPMTSTSSSSSPMRSGQDDSFDDRLDAARRQQQSGHPPQDEAKASSGDEAPASKSHGHVSTRGAKKAVANENNTDGDDGINAASVMLQLIGQSAPAQSPVIASPATGTDVAAAAPSGMPALALSLQSEPVTDAQIPQNSPATQLQAKLSGLPANLFPANPKLAGLGKADAIDDKSLGKPGQDDGKQILNKSADSHADALNVATASAVRSNGAADDTSSDAITQASPHKDNDFSALLGLSGSQASGSVAAPAHVVQMQSPLDSSGFAQELGQQVAWMGGHDIKEARIRLNPEELGELEVKVSVEHNRVDVVFAAQHPAAVTAVQQTLGQLDTMLAGQGLSLGQAQVGQQQQSFSGSTSGRGRTQQGDGDVNDAAVEASPLRRVALGLLDTFA
ncbi:flagellar hook-length control protein FliK [Dyella sp.]|uniref:flagellar hook-length control protein FliK n=1 Tax=Dyella sp. TaxID=1869338 RepID=UPI002ED3F2DF